LINRDYNLYFQVKDTKLQKLFKEKSENPWEYYEPKIDFHNRNLEFWKLTNDNHRRYIIEDIINKVVAKVVAMENN
jgi:hypothetical protein